MQITAMALVRKIGATGCLYRKSAVYIVPSFKNMPFSRDFYLGRFNPSELNDLQTAYLQSCEKLNRCAITSPYRDEMAREIIQIFECGVKDPAKIVDLMIMVDSVKPKMAQTINFQNSQIAPPQSL